MKKISPFILVLAAAVQFAPLPTSADCAYNTTQATCACPTSSAGVTCTGGELFTDAGYTCVPDPRSCAANQKLQCPSNTGCVCNTTDYPCGGCTPPTSQLNTDCTLPNGGFPANPNCPKAINAQGTAAPANAAAWGVLIANGYFSNRCQATSCNSGYDFCSSTSGDGKGYCVQRKTNCPAGTTWDICTASCKTPYVLFDPAAGVTQAGNVYMNDSNLYLSGPSAGKGDFYMNNGKSVRVDGSATAVNTNLYVANWYNGGSPFDLNVITKNSAGQTSTVIGDAGCSDVRAGIGIGWFSGCNNYTLLGGDGNTYLSRSGGKDIFFQKSGAVNPVTQMTLKDSGWLGVGTTPQSMLHVYGGQTWGSDMSLDASGVGSGATAGHRWLLISTGGASPVPSSEGAGKLIFKDQTANAGAGAVRLTIDNVGNVGIGTTNPSSAFDVNGAITLLGQTATPGCPADNNGRFYYDSSSDVFKFVSGKAGVCGAYGTFIYASGTGTANQMTKFSGPGSITNSIVTDTGAKIGVGTTAPNKLFHVYSVAGDNAEIDIQSVAGANSHWAIYNDRVSGDLRIWNNLVPGDANALKMLTNGTVSMHVAQVVDGAAKDSVLISADANGTTKWETQLCTGGKVVGVTPGAYDANQGGYSGMNARCHAVGGIFTNSHICTPDEIMRTVKCSASGTLPGSLIVPVPAWIANGAPGFTSPASNDCGGFTTYVGYGDFWRFNGDTGGKGFATDCAAINQMKIACCK